MRSMIVERRYSSTTREIKGNFVVCVSFINFVYSFLITDFVFLE